jgi:hypothetical protein
MWTPHDHYRRRVFLTACLFGVALAITFLPQHTALTTLIVNLAWLWGDE